MKNFFTALVLALVLVNQTIAYGNIQANLNSSFTDLTYQLSQVSDEDLKQEIIKTFENDMKVLIEQGLTAEELMAYIATQIQNQEVKADFYKVTSASNFKELGTAKTLDLALKTLTEGQKSGSHWVGNGEVLLYGLAIALIVATVLLADGVYVSGCYDWDYYYNTCYYYY